MTGPDTSGIPWDVITEDMLERAAVACARWHNDDATNEQDYILAMEVLRAALEVGE